MYYVYVLKNQDSKKLYYGFSSNLKQRVKQHQAKEPWKLVYYEAYGSEADARKREKKLKHYAQALTALKVRISGSLAGCGV